MAPPSGDEGGIAQSAAASPSPLDGAALLEAARYRKVALSRLMTRLHERFQSERAVAVFTTEDGELDLKRTHRFAPVAGEEDDRISRTIVEDVAERRTPVLIENALRHPVLRDQSSVLEQGIRSVMCVPMVAGGELLGVIYVDNLSEGAKFTPEDLDMLNLAASYAAASLYGARLLEGRDTTPDKQPGPEKGPFDKVTAGIAHDFKNVLAAIQTRLRLTEQANEELAEGIAKAREAVRTGRDFAEQVANYARICSREETEPVDLAAVLREALDLMRDRMQVEETHHELRFDIPDSAPLPGNRVQLKEVAINLLSNALDAMGDGGTLSVSLGREGADWILTVGDTGPGISEEHLDRLFEPFFTTKGTGGMGLGLSMVKSVVNSHGGSVSVDSTPGQGTVFEVRLPSGP